MAPQHCHTPGCQCTTTTPKNCKHGGSGVKQASKLGQRPSHTYCRAATNCTLRNWPARAHRQGRRVALHQPHNAPEPGSSSSTSRATARAVRCKRGTSKRNPTHLRDTLGASCATCPARLHSNASWSSACERPRVHPGCQARHHYHRAVATHTLSWQHTARMR